MRSIKNYVLAYILIFSLFLGGALFLSKTVGQWLPVSADASEQRLTVVLDPGHGGEDGGAVSPNGTRECDLNLQISLRVRDLLGLLGIRTVMTRSEDKSIYDEIAGTVAEKKVSDLKNRAALANAHKDALFVSIHQNMFSESRYHGAQVFFAPSQKSDTLANSLQTLLRECIDPDNHREAKQSTAVWLMEHIENTGVLVECGFLSNPEEEQLLKTEEYQKKLSAVIVCGIEQFLTGDTNEI